MTDPREREQAGTRAEERRAPVRDADAPEGAVDRTGRVPPPSPEEAPELLGERSDYPGPFGDAS